jgi:hypothetical protein
MSQLLSTQDPINGSQRRHQLNARVFKLPLNRLSSAKQAFVIETETNHLNGLNYFLSQLTRAALRARRSALLPSVESSAPSAFDLGTHSRVTHRSGDGGDLFTAQVTINRKLPVALLFSFFPLHRRLQLLKGINVEQKAKSRKVEYPFQRTVNDVLALNCVNDVLALINYGLLTTDY